MAGIYLHIPFCRKACTYCDFHFSTTLRLQEAMVQAMVWEIEARKDFFPSGTEIQTLYFGGGTPSVLLPDELQAILATLRTNFSFAADLEFTFECNPDDLSEEYLQQLKAAGVNRLSIGIQSFRGRDLELMNRSHSVEQAHEAVAKAQKIGFENITVDLIYGIPELSMEAWAENVQQVIQMGVPHVSAYALTVEEKTVLHHQVEKGTVRVEPDETFAKQYFYLIDALTAAGFEHYELSNFARPGYRSRHNSAYWEGIPYLGIGPSAHSFIDATRHWNVAKNAAYIRMCKDQELPIAEAETLSPIDRLNEYLMTHLRKTSGIDLEHIQSVFGVDLGALEGEQMRSFVASGEAIWEDSTFRLTRYGLMVSDHIIGELFQV